MLDLIKERCKMAKQIKADTTPKPKPNVGGFGQQPPQLEIPRHPDDKRKS
jgi:hypothetical protein